MRTPALLLLLVAFSWIQTSCDETPPQIVPNNDLPSALNNPTPKELIALDLPALGEVHAKMKLGASNEETYAIYLPKSYKAEAKYPILYLFDPNADGKLPVERYAALAEEFGYILIGSNVSRNGLPPTMLSQHTNNLIAWCSKQYSYDSNRMYVMGFSGGARVAAMIAQSNTEIDAVIGCSAGFDPTQSRAFPYLGIVGDGDFNYLEMQRLMGYLMQQNSTCHLTVFHGTHEWPSVETARDAFLFTVLESMRSNAVVKDQQFIDDSYEIEVEKAARYATAGNLEAEAMMQAQKIKVFYNGLVELDAVEQLINTIANTEAWSKHLKARQTLAEHESQLQAKYGQLIQGSTAEWKREIEKLEQIISAENSTLEKAEAQRLKGYMGIMIYSYCGRALGQNDLKALPKLLEFYEICEPENPEWAYMRAAMLFREQKNEAAMESLDKCFDLGFTDRDRITNDPDFTYYINSPRFAEMPLE